MSKTLSAGLQLLGVLLILIGMANLLHGSLTESKTVYWPLILFPCGIITFLAGGVGARWKRCSNCGCTLANKDLTKCPRCYFEFKSKL